MEHRHAHGRGLPSSVAAGAVVGIGIGAIASLSLGAVIVAWCLATSMAAAWTLLVALTVETQPSLRDACRSTLTGGTTLAGAVGLLLLSPAAFVLGILVIGSTSAARMRVRGWWKVLATGAEPHSEPPNGPKACRPLAVTDVITDEDLWRAWDSSGRSLSRAASPAGRLRDAEFRALVLDELDRRANAARTDDGT